MRTRVTRPHWTGPSRGLESPMIRAERVKLGNIKETL